MVYYPFTNNSAVEEVKPSTAKKEEPKKEEVKVEKPAPKPTAKKK